MGNVLDPKPPQWVKKAAEDESVPEDLVLDLSDRLMEVMLAVLEGGHVYPTVVQLAALRLVQRGIAFNYAAAMGADSAKEVLRQAEALADQYTVQVPDGR